jgi:hypothetical protein
MRNKRKDLKEEHKNCGREEGGRHFLPECDEEYVNSNCFLNDEFYP